MAHPGTPLEDMMRRFGEVTATLTNISRAITGAHQNVNISVNLGSQLSGAGTPQAQARVLGKVISLRMGGKSTDAIKSALGEYKGLSVQQQRLMEHRVQLDKKIRFLRKKMHALPAGARGFSGLPQRIRDAQKKRSDVVNRMNRLRDRSKSVMGEAKGKAAHELGMAATIGKLNVTVAALSGIVKAGIRVAGMGRQIVGEYGQYSTKGIQAINEQFYGDLRRQMRISNVIGDDMLEFTKSWQNMMNSLEPIITKVTQMTLKAGKSTTDFFNDFLGMLGPVFTRKVTPEQKNMFDAINIPAGDRERMRRGLPPQSPEAKKVMADAKKLQEEADKKKKDEQDDKFNQGNRQFERFRKSLRPGRFRGPGLSIPMNMQQKGPGQAVNEGGMTQIQKDQMAKIVESRMEANLNMMQGILRQKHDWEDAHGTRDAEGKLHIKIRGKDEAAQYQAFGDAQTKLERQRRRLADELKRIKELSVTPDGPARAAFLTPIALQRRTAMV